MFILKIIAAIALLIIPGGFLILLVSLIRSLKAKPTGNSTPSRPLPLGFTLTREQDRKTSSDGDFFKLHQQQTLKKFAHLE